MAGTVDFSICSLNRSHSVPVSDDDLRNIGQRLIDELREDGTIGLQNTGFSFQQLAEARTAAAKFFSLPEITKRRYIMKEVTSQFRGYMPVGEEWLDSEDHRDFKESLSLSGELKGMVRYSLFREHNFLQTDLEKEIPGFCASMRGVVADYAALSEKVLQCIALAAGLEKDAFKETCYGDVSSQSDMEEVSQLKVVNYLPLKEHNNAKDSIRCGKHKDGSLITLLVPDDVGGLQFKRPAGDWSDVSCEEEVVCLHAGFGIEVLFSGKIKAWEHRVIFKNDESRHKRRLGFIFFLTGKSGVMHKPLDGSDAYHPFSPQKVTEEFFKTKKSYNPE